MIWKWKAIPGLCGVKFRLALPELDNLRINIALFLLKPLERVEPKLIGPDGHSKPFTGERAGRNRRPRNGATPCPRTIRAASIAAIGSAAKLVRGRIG